MLGDRLDRHLVRRYLEAFLALLAGLCALYAVIDFADRAGDYVGPGWAVWAARLYANRLAEVAVQLSPAAMLIAAGLTLSSLRVRGELTATLAAGRSAGRIALPLALATLAVGAVVYEFDDAYAVHAALRAERISIEHFHLWGSAGHYLLPKRWMRLGPRILHVGDPLPGGGFRDVSILETSPDFTLRRRLDARELVPAGGDLWTLRDVEERTFDPGSPLPQGGRGQRGPETPLPQGGRGQGGPGTPLPQGGRGQGEGETFRKLDELQIDLPGGETLGQIAPGRPDMLSRAELRRQIALRSKLGLGSDEQWFEYWSRVAYVLVGAAGALLAAALALRAGRRGHVATALLEGLVVAAALWALLGIARALSLAGRLPPVVCAFAPEAFGLLAGAWLLRRVDRRPAW